MRGKRDQNTQRKGQSVQRPSDVFGRYGGNRISSVSVLPGSKTGHQISGVVYAYDRSTRRYEPHWFVPISTAYRVVAIIVSAIGVAIGIGVIITELMMQ